MTLVGTHEIRIMLGGRLSRQRVYQLTRRRDFPAPVVELAQGKIWRAEDVETWIATHRTSQPPPPPGPPDGSSTACG